MKIDDLSTIAAHLQQRNVQLKTTAYTHQGMRYRYFMLRSIEHEAALDALCFIQSLLGQNTTTNWDDSLLGRLGQMERLYAERWPAIARKSTSPRPLCGHPSPSQWRGDGGEVDTISQHLSDQFSTPSLGSIARLRLAAGVAALNYLRTVLTSTSQRTIIAALLELERNVLAWWDERAES